MVKETNLTTIQLVQQLDEKYWEVWDDKTPIEEAQKGNCKLLLQSIVDKLNRHNISVAEAHGIIHDKDTQVIWDNKQLQYVETPKTKHVHFLFKFTKGASLNKLAVAIGIEPSYLERLKSGRYGYENCLAYLVHAKEETKYQYLPTEVVTVEGRPYIDIYNEKKDLWAQGRAKKAVQKTYVEVDWLISKILNFELSKQEIMDNENYYKIYGQHKKRVNEALDTAGERKGYLAQKEIDDRLFKKTILFIAAKSGAGKTRFSKELIKLLEKVSVDFGQRWKPCITASTNSFDEYNGQEILFLDDMRGDSLTVSDWLKLLDPYMISPISARYRNKVCSAKVIIITSPLTPVKFFSAAKSSLSEDFGQFVRRIDFLVTIDNDFELSIPEQRSVEDDYFGVKSSYAFSNPQNFSKNESMNIIVKTIIKNMQWHKKGYLEDRPRQKR